MTLKRPATVDVAVGVLLVVLGQLEAWSQHGVAHAVVTLCATLPLIWRRSAPVVVLAVTVLALTSLTAVGSDEFTVAQLLGLMLALFTVATECALRQALVAVAVTVVAAVANSASAGSRDAGDYVFPVILLGVPWAAGLSLRRWRERAEELRVLNAALAEEREAHARLAVVAERGRIARDLHDSLAQSLNAMVVHAEAAEEAMGRDQRQVDASLQRIKAVGRSSLAETRQLLGALREGEHGQELAVSDLPRLVDRSRADGLTVEYNAKGDAEDLPSSVQAAVYRIVQESLTNVSRHSDSRRAAVEVEYGDEVLVRVRDEGDRGDSSPGRGLGLLGMRERAVLLGGEFRAGFEIGGFVVEARIPRHP